VLLDNLLAKENLIDNQIILPVENNKKRHTPLNILSRDNGDPPAKRRLDFTDMDEGCGPAIALAPNVTLNDKDPNQFNHSLTSMEHLEDEDYTVITYFGIVDKKGNLQPLPSIESYITTTGSGGDFSKSPYNMTRVVLPDIDSTKISAFINGIILFFIKSVDVVCARKTIFHYELV